MPREIAIALGGSRNDLLAAATATGFGAYLASQGMNCPVLRLAAPSGRRRHDFMGGNSFSPMRLEVPTSGPPGPHFGVISERLSTTRREPAARFTDAVAATLSRLPGRLLVAAVHGQAGSVDFVATALPGLRHSRQLLGAQVEASYPFGPRLGCPVNFTAFGNDDRLDVGISFDPFAIEHPDALVAHVAGAFAELATTAGAGGRAISTPSSLAPRQRGSAAAGQPSLVTFWPPSTSKAAPVTHELSGEARNRTMAPMSSGVPTRPTAICSASDARRASDTPAVP